MKYDTAPLNYIFNYILDILSLIWLYLIHLINNAIQIAGFRTQDQLSRIWIKTKEKVCMRLEFNSQRICLGLNHGRYFFV